MDSESAVAASGIRLRVRRRVASDAAERRVASKDRAPLITVHPANAVARRRHDHRLSAVSPGASNPRFTRNDS